MDVKKPRGKSTVPASGARGRAAAVRRILQAAYRRHVRDPLTLRAARQHCR